MKRFFIAFAPFLLAACPGSAPDLPPIGQSASAAAGSYAQLNCQQIAQQYQANRSKREKVEQLNLKRHRENQVAGYIGSAIAAPAYVFSQSNSSTDEQLAQLTQERDGLNAAWQLRRCQN
jgi:ribosomal protein S17E